MKNLIRHGLGAALAGALALYGMAQAQSNTGAGAAGSSTGSGSPDAVGKGDTGRPSDSVSGGSSAKGSSSSTSSGMTGTGSSDTATGGAGASAGSSSTATGASSAGQKIDKKLQDRLEKIHAANQAELQMAQLGTQNAQSPDVQQFATQMQTDHQQLDRQLTQQAQTMGVSLEGKTFQKETESAQKDLQKMQSKTGKDFDKAYMDRMVKDHEKDLKEVKDTAKDAQKGKHTELASALQEAQTTIQTHLDRAKQVQKSLKSGGTASSASGSSSMGTGSANQPTHDPSAQPKGSDTMKSGSRGDTGGPTPGGQDRSTAPSGSTVTPGGGEKGSSSDSGTK
jgi:putative membrane protein